MTNAPDVTAARESLARSAFLAGEYDFRPVAKQPGLLLSRPPRHGVSLIVGPTSALPDAAIDALLSWRLGQYILTGFYDHNHVARESMLREPREQVHAADLHALAVDADGALVAYITLKQPEGVRDSTGWYRDRDRPPFPCEEVHGRGWQKSILGVDSVELRSCWEMARFVTDQRRPFLDPIRHRGPLELALAAARLATHPEYSATVQLITGDLDPEVALRNLRFFFVPVVAFAPHQVELPDGHPLAPRYRDHLTAPFVATAVDIDYATYIRWADIDLALSRDDEDTYRRFLALGQFVSVKESSLKRPLLPPDDSVYPIESLTSPSSLQASLALWRSAEHGEIPWQARVLGPGDSLLQDQVAWVVDGFAQARTGSFEQPSHLAGIGPEVAFVPDERYLGDILSLQAVTPMRALITQRADFEDFWRQRQALFETSTDKLYGLQVSGAPRADGAAIAEHPL